MLLLLAGCHIWHRRKKNVNIIMKKKKEKDKKEALTS